MILGSKQYEVRMVICIKIYSFHGKFHDASSFTQEMFIFFEEYKLCADIQNTYNRFFDCLLQCDCMCMHVTFKVESH